MRCAPGARVGDRLERTGGTSLRPAGAITINANAVPVLREQGRSLLAIGVTGVRGRFAAGEVVNILGPDESVLARGEAAFDDSEVRGMAGKSTDELRPRFPGRKRLEVVHRDDLVVLKARPLVGQPGQRPGLQSAGAGRHLANTSP